MTSNRFFACGFPFGPSIRIKALRRDVRELAQALEPHRAVDEVPQQRLAGIDIASQKVIDRLLQRGFPE